MYSVTYELYVTYSYLASPHLQRKLTKWKETAFLGVINLSLALISCQFHASLTPWHASVPLIS